MEDIHSLKLILSRVKSINRRAILERQLQAAVRCLIGATNRTLERALATLRYPIESKINKLYRSQPAMTERVLIQDLKVRIV